MELFRRSRDRVPSMVIAVFSGFACSCTFTGLGDYPIGTCASPLGTTTMIQAVGSLGAPNDLVFTQVNGQTPFASFTNDVDGAQCVQGVGGDLGAGCDFFDSSASSPRQPWITPLGGGSMVAAIATTSPCTQGVLTAQVGSGTMPLAMTACASTGAALPAAVAIAGGSSAIVAWYATSIDSRTDPLQSCTAALAAPLEIARVQAPSSGAPIIDGVQTLTAASTGVRPPAVTFMPSTSLIAVAAPDESAVSVWTVDASDTVQGPIAIASLGGARAVAVGADASGHLAVVAEIGCTPQAIELAIGTIESGFTDAIPIAQAGSDFAVNPSVAWVASEGYWIVSWISGDGGAHALARRIAADGSLVGGILDPSLPATAATVMASGTSSPDGSLIAYVPGGPSGGSIMNASLGCIQQAHL